MENGKHFSDCETVLLDETEQALVIIDQTKLPNETCILKLRELEEIHRAIYLLQVRGAPAIGVAAAIGLYLAAARIQAGDFPAFYRQFQKDKDYLESARPTAVNLSWALNRMDQVCLAHQEQPIPQILEALRQEAVAIREEDIQVCKAIGEHGLSLVRPKDGILTHCNAGRLATVKYGTATAPLYLGQERGYQFRIFADETRPLLQGARLTAYELQEAGMDVTLICDNMSDTVMRKGWVQAVFVGCDRVAANGDVANKIGTAIVATVAKKYNVPFYVCAPTSTIDLRTPSGNDIVIEERPGTEVTELWYSRPMAPEGVKVFNPAFDVTDHSYITAIVTEYGIVRPPYGPALAEIMGRKGVKLDG